MQDQDGKIVNVGDEVYYPGSGIGVVKEISEGCARAQFKNSERHRLYGKFLKKLRPWKELASLALQVQDACNLSGVVHSFSAIISEVRIRLDAEGKGGTDNVNTHPVCVLFADKIAQLTGTQSLGNEVVSEAYKWVENKAKGE